jgi:signal transduction histidine kinase
VSEATAPAAWHHAVQFYEDDGFLCRAVAEFLAPALTTAEPAFVIATPPHREAILAHLRDMHGCDPEMAILTGDLVVLDARDTLATFIVDGQPDAARFEARIGPILARLRRGREDATVYAYGEMVDLLWRVGMQEGALALEAMWNTLGAGQPFSLLCGYAMSHFSDETQRAPFDAICRQHTHVAPTERYAMVADEDARQREITRLQQRAISLEAEIEHRKGLERALRQALAERAHAESDRARLLKRERKARGDAVDASRVDLIAMLTAALDWVRPSADAKGIQLDLHIDASARFVTGDAERLQQIMWNLLSNAIKFTPVAGRVDVSLDVNATVARIIVRDTGQGIAREFLPHVFDPFRQVDTGITRSRSGLGLGLAVAKYVVESHGGTVEADSPGEGHGASFTITLPVRRH